MKIPKLFATKKLRATTARRSLGLPDDMNYEEMSEPNMKLSRALLIVLVLHVVAVAGIIAFNTIKTRQGPMPAPSAHAATASASPAAAAKTDSASSIVTTTAAVAKHEQPKPTHGSEKIIGKIGPKADAAKPAEKASATPAASKTTYVVAKGDNPVKIAKKFKVPYDELLAANHIDDPHKLKVGQKLAIPATQVRKAKKVDDER
jgi:LysM repeat protein